jgi:hypothetical protein
MRRKSNVNPDHYKTAGRERPGEDIVQEIHKEKLARARVRTARSRSQVVPGAPQPVGETKVSARPAQGE